MHIGNLAALAGISYYFFYCSHDTTVHITALFEETELFTESNDVESIVLEPGLVTISTYDASHRSASRPKGFFSSFFEKNEIFNVPDLIRFDRVKPKDNCAQHLISVDTYLKVSNFVYFVSLESHNLRRIVRQALLPLVLPTFVARPKVGNLKPYLYKNNHFRSQFRRFIPVSSLINSFIRPVAELPFYPKLRLLHSFPSFQVPTRQ